jgi:TolB-like protein/DNA-binding winged helix-turn-helix (wHTH) protein/tetratricopeptide (TPR) repeat protein
VPGGRIWNTLGWRTQIRPNSFQGISKETPKIPMHLKGGHLYSFGSFRLDPDERQFWKDGGPVALTPKVFDLLVVLVENRGTLLEKDRLLQLVWPDSFVEEANLSVNISSLRRVLGEVPGEPRFIETLPKRGYRFIAEVTELDRQLTPQAPVPAQMETNVIEEVRPAPVIPQKDRRAQKWLLASAAAMAVLLGAFYYWTSARATPLSRIRTIAVLPFATLSSDGSQNYLGLGMADALITKLGKLQRLTVRPTSAVLRYANNVGDVVQSGKVLQVEAVLEGTVQQSGDRIRTTVRLVRVSDGKTLWTEKFDDTFTNIFPVQDAISEKVASTLAGQLTEPEIRSLTEKNTADTEAYQMYLQGQYLASRRIHGDRLRAIAFFEEATAKDPNYALAYAALASSRIISASNGWGDQTAGKAKSAALKSLALNETLPDAHLAMGEVLFRGDWDFAGAGIAFDRALALNNHLSGAHAAKSLLLTALGRHAEALREMEQAVRFDPSSADTRADLAFTHYSNRRFDDAIEQAKFAVRIDPGSFSAHNELRRAYTANGKKEDALDECEKLKPILGSNERRALAECGVVRAHFGEHDKAAANLRAIRAIQSSEPEPLFQMVEIEANLNDRDSAFRDLEIARQRGLAAAIWMNVDPELDNLRQDPRFEQLLRKAGL